MGNATSFCNQDNQFTLCRIKSTEIKTSLNLKIKLWKKDSYGLFDYECKSMEEFQFKIHEEGTLLCKENSCIYLPKDSLDQQD